MFKPDKLQLRAEITNNQTHAERVAVSMLVNGCKLPFTFSVRALLYALEYSGRINLLYIPGQNAVQSDIIIDESNYWIWKNHFIPQQPPMVWHFERDKALRQLKRLQNSLAKLTENKPELTFDNGETIPEVIAYEYKRPKLLWHDYFNKELAKKLLAVKNNGWQTDENDLKEIEKYLLDGAYIYKENRSGKRLLDKILDQPNAQLKELVCKIANYPLTEPDTNTITLIKDGKEKRFGAPKRMSLREALERDFLVEIYE